MKRLILCLTAGLLAFAGPAAAKEYLLTGAKPNRIVLVDPAARKVEKVFEIPGKGAAPTAIAPSPDGKVAYVLTNHLESVVGISLDDGKVVFRADMSKPPERVKSIFSLEVSPDGKELYVFQSPVLLGLGEYRVQDTRIAVYDTSAGLKARPARTFPAPRRTAVLVASKDGQTLYALSWDLYALDPKTGAVKGVHKILNWERPNYAPPDILDFWPQFEQAAVFSTPYFAARTDKDPATDPSAFRTGMLTLDLKTGEVEMDDFEDTSAIIFSSVVNPARRNEVFSVYTQLSKIDRAKDELVKRVELPHTYYAINISGDGKEVYVGGTMCDIGIHSTETLERLGSVEMPDCGDMGVASLRVVQR